MLLKDLVEEIDYIINGKTKGCKVREIWIIDAGAEYKLWIFTNEMGHTFNKFSISKNNIKKLDGLLLRCRIEGIKIRHFR